MESLISFFEKQCHEHSSSIWLESHNMKYSYIDSLNIVNILAKKLSPYIKKRTLVAIKCKDQHMTIFLTFALLKLDAIPVVLHSAYPENLVNNLKHTYGFCTIVSNSSSDLKEPIEISEDIYVSILGTSNTDSKQLKEAAIGFFTSGTTAIPKLVLLTSENIISNVESIQDYMEVNSSDKLILIKSLSHASTFTGEIMLSLFVGFTLFIVISNFSPRYISRVIKDYHISIINGVPTIFRQFKKFNIAPNPFVRAVTVMGETVFKHDYDLLKMLFPNALRYIAYGQTEAGPRVSCLLPADIETGNSSVGRAIKHSLIEIIDDNDKSLEPNTIGNIVVSGPSIMIGYYLNDNENKIKLRNGKLWTGDIGYLDENGYLYVVGRKDDLFQKGGENIFPMKIEMVLYSLPGISGAVVYNIPDPDKGNKIIAKIEVVKNKELSAQEVLRHCTANLASFEIPDTIEFCAELPRNIQGKILRRHGGEVQ